MPLMIDHAFIDKLPYEIMSNIFLLAIRPIRPRHYRTRSALAKLATIVTVSKRWKSIIDAAPELWSFLHSSDPIKITRMALEKSKDASLTITCIQYRYPKADKDMVATRFIDCVKPHVARWRFVFFRASSPALRRIPAAAAPRLFSLTLQCRDDELPLDNPFGHQTPQLRELICMRTAFAWNSALLAGLSSLKIVLVENERLFIRCSELYAALAWCPCLQSLIITQPTPRADDPLVLNGVPILRFPDLTEIKLSMPSALTNVILAYIEAPRCNTFMAEANVESAELLERLVPYLPKLINNRPLESWKVELFLETQRIKFTLTPAHKRFTVWEPFELELSGHWLPTFSWIIDRLLPSAIRQFPMILHFSLDCEHTETLKESFLRLPHVQKLILEHNRNPELVWGWLARPIQNNEGAPRWLFSELLELEIYGDKYGWDLLVAAAWSRWGSNENMDRPESLETLRFIGADLNEEQMGSLKEVIGSENVTQGLSDLETDSAESEWRADLLL